jgi:hypothetical protein
MPFSSAQERMSLVEPGPSAADDRAADGAAAARERRLRIKAAREKEREQFRAEYRRLFAANRADAPPGV